ncbi:MAG: hypothetical protein D4R44_06900 [Actinobacteria bacterium]|nr:MAG: hypothetical protein D4R44_06900 [Actinomycetota bacterium]
MYAYCAIHRVSWDTDRCDECLECAELAAYPTTEIEALKLEAEALRQQVETLKQQLEYTAEAFTKASHHCINMDIQIGGLNGNRPYDETYKALLNLKQKLAQACDEALAAKQQLAKRDGRITEMRARRDEWKRAWYTLQHDSSQQLEAQSVTYQDNLTEIQLLKAQVATVTANREYWRLACIAAQDDRDQACRHVKDLAQQIADLASRVQRLPTETETVCGDCGGHGWVERGY